MVGNYLSITGDYCLPLSSNTIKNVTAYELRTIEGEVSEIVWTD